MAWSCRQGGPGFPGRASRDQRSARAESRPPRDACIPDEGSYRAGGERVLCRGATDPGPSSPRRRRHNDAFLEVTEDRVIRPDGRPGTYATVSVNQGVAVLVANGDGTVSLVRQFRYALGRESLEAACGGVDEGEEPLAAAHREAPRSWASRPSSGPTWAASSSIRPSCMSHVPVPGQRADLAERTVRAAR